MNTYFVATDVKGRVSVNSSFLHRSFLNLTAKKLKFSTFSKVIVKIKAIYFYLRYSIVLISKSIFFD